MKIRWVLKPDNPGAKKLVAEYGGCLVCVRYRYDEVRQLRLKTVELIVDQVFWERNQPVLSPDQLVGITIKRDEVELRKVVTKAGGRWNPERFVWELPYSQVLELKKIFRNGRDSDGTITLPGF